MRIAAQVFFDFVEQVFNLCDLWSLSLRQFLRDIGQSQVDSDQQLPCFVVDGISDTLDLLLERFVQLTQSLYGVLESPLRHFIGGHAFRQEIRTCIYQMRLGFLVRQTLEQLLESLMMNRSQLEQTLAFGNGAPAEFVRAA